MLTITCVRQMVHAQVHPYDQVFLFQGFAVEEFVKVYHWLVDVLTVIRMARPWLRIFLFCDCKIMFKWMSSVFQISRMFDGQMTSSVARQDSIAAILAVFVRLIRVYNSVLMQGSIPLASQLYPMTELTSS